jgi:hypothetical protein
MEPLAMILVPGLIGGVVFAVAFFLVQRGDGNRVAVPYRSEPPSTDIINMAHIKVSGVGGIGLVAMAAAVALDIPRIFQTVSLGLILGTVGATILIVRRRTTGPLPSSGRRMGANTTLSIDPPA